MVFLFLTALSILCILAFSVKTNFSFIHFHAHPHFAISLIHIIFYLLHWTVVSVYIFHSLLLLVVSLSAAVACKFPTSGINKISAVSFPVSVKCVIWCSLFTHLNRPALGGVCEPERVHKRCFPVKHKRQKFERCAVKWCEVSALCANVPVEGFKLKEEMTNDANFVCHWRWNSLSFYTEISVEQSNPFHSFELISQ